MTYQVVLPPALEDKLRERAAAIGTDAESFIVQTLADELEGPKSFREIFAPLHQAFAQSSVSDDELTGLVDQVREVRYRGRQHPTPKTP